MMENLRIPADGIELAASLYHDENATASDTVVLLNGALGKSRDFYAPMMQFLAASGIDGVCWDYRGAGDSLNGSVADTQAAVHDWGERDLPVMIDWLRARYPGRRLVIIAHSIGGQIIGMTPRSNLAAGIVLIGSQSGYWRLWSGWERLRIGFLWHVVIPFVSRLHDEFPARWFGFEANLPNAVVCEWARWGRDPEYLMGRHRRASADNYAGIDRPILNVWIGDDDMAPHAANRRMLGWYPNARITNLDLRPADLGVDRIGHFRLFRESVGPKFWPKLLEWLVEKSKV